MEDTMAAIDLEEQARLTSDIIKQARKLEEKAISDYLNVLYNHVVLPALKDWQLQVMWAMGGVCFFDYEWNDVKDEDPRVKMIVKELDWLCKKSDSKSEKYGNDLWGVLSEIDYSGFIDSDSKYHTYDEYIKLCRDTTTREGKTSFSTLKRGDALYVVDFDSGDIETTYVEDVRVIGDMIEVHPLINGKHQQLPTKISVVPSAYRHENIYLDKGMADKDMNVGFELLANYFEFKFNREVPYDEINHLLS
jgi:hypothetical protein